jgi:hypothetical protein
MQPVQLAAAHRIDERCAFHEIVAREREEAPLRRAADRVAGATDALQKGVDRARRTQLAHEIDIADVDSQFERSGGNERLQLTAFQSAARHPGRRSLARLP